MTFIKKITNHVDVPKILPTQLANFNHDEDSENHFLLSKVGIVNNGQLKFHKNPINQNIRLSLGQYTVVLKYLRDH